MGVPILRMRVFSGLHWGSPYFGALLVVQSPCRFPVQVSWQAMYKLDGIITVVDSKHVMQHLDEKKPEGVENEAGMGKLEISLNPSYPYTVVSMSFCI